MSEPVNATKNNNNVVIMVIVGAVLVLILCMCCFIPFMTVMLLGNYNSQSSFVDFPQPSPLEIDKQTVEDDIKQYYVGDIVESENRTLIVQQYEDPYLPLDREMLLDGEKLVAVYIEATNNSQYSTYFSSYDWVLKDGNGNTYFFTPFDNYKEPAYLGKTLEPAQTNSGWITFAVPKDVPSLSLVSNVSDIYTEVVLY